MSLHISQSHRVLSVEGPHTHMHTSVHRGDCSLHSTAFSPEKASWECVTQAAVLDNRLQIGMDGACGAPLWEGHMHWPPSVPCPMTDLFSLENRSKLHVSGEFCPQKVEWFILSEHLGQSQINTKEVKQVKRKEKKRSKIQRKKTHQFIWNPVTEWGHRWRKAKNCSQKSTNWALTVAVTSSF